MNLKLVDRVVFVAGGSRGIGKAIARSFWAEGARVAIGARNEESLRAAASDIAGPESTRLVTVACDVTRLDDVERAREIIDARWSHPDVVVASVGNGIGPRGWQIDDDAWNSSLESNLRGSVRVGRVFAPGMVRRGNGCFTFIGSIVGVESMSAPVQYSASKAALASYVKNFARELGPHGVRANLVAPGNILFEGGSWDRRRAAEPVLVEQMLKTDVPLGRFGNTQEVADIVLFLSSDRASFVTGACWVADGGQTRSL
jgi:3-oxoacyl-[acyl-carrier protein] reductase